jgi:hypothetical protein
MATQLELDEARRAFLHEIAEEIRQGNKDWTIGPCLNRATQAALTAAERVRCVSPEGHGEPCYYCGNPCSVLAGDANEWPLPLSHEDNPGVMKWHHTGCVSERIRAAEHVRWHPRPIDEWHEDIGDVLWWKFPITEAPYVGSPNDLGHTVQVTIGVVDGGQRMTQMAGGWPGYHTHWTPIPLPSPPEESK